MDEVAGLADHPEAAVGEALHDILGRAPEERHLKIVDGARAVRGESGHVSPAHQIDEEGHQSAFDDMPPVHDEQRLPGRTPRDHDLEKLAKLLPSQQTREAVEKRSQLRSGLDHLGQIAARDLAGRLMD